MKKLKFMADYQCHPIWDLSPGHYGDVDPNSLPLSEKLKLRITEWARSYDETLNWNNPIESGFKSLEAESDFKKEGLSIFSCLQDELGDGFFIIKKYDFF